MNLKKLEILGFKSFANKTVIHFSGGITAVVGPNGCGKTNILDALRWVLGEQKVTLLRGSKMEEVIFNGTRDMKALGMAEVTLTLVNNRGVLPTEYNEVQITRRLFRSGDSEYLLNKVPCRLKDIAELFYDTGLGAHSYSVIQQDMIEAVISDRAEERRFLFEEAAGITKYKQRKKVALRKLEATENDFLRLNDIYAEVQTQVRSLKRQQRKAERYQNVLDDIKQWELFLSSTRVRQIENERRALKAKHDALTDQMSEVETRLSQASSQLEGDRREQVDIEQELSRVGNEIFEISEKAHTLERDISVLKEKKANASTLTERNHADIEALNIRAELLAEQDNETVEALEAHRKEMEAVEADLHQAESVQAEADRMLHAARSAKEQENSQLIELEGKLSSGRTQDDNLRSQESEISDNITRIEKILGDNTVHRKELAASVETSRQAHEKKEAESAQIELTRQMEELVEKGEDLNLQMADLNASVEACQARKNLLEDMILHYEGYESGVKAAMEVRERWPEIAGTVAEKFVPVEGLEVAVEAALGDMARFLICHDRATAEAIISYLRAESKGKIGILVPDSGTINPVVKRPELTMPEFVGWLDNLVATDEKLQPLMRAVLSRTAVFKAGSRPDDLLERLPYGFKAVSTNGEVYSKNVIAGGSDDKMPLFRRKEKVTEQERMIEQLKGQLSAVQESKGRVTAEIADARARLGNLAEKIDTLSEQVSEARQALNEVEYQNRTAGTEISRLENEKKAYAEKLEAIRSHQYTLGLDFSQLTSQRQTLVDTISQSDARLSDYEAAATTALEHMSRLQVKLVESRSRIDQDENKLTHLRELKQEINNTVVAKQGEIESAQIDITTSSEKALVLEEELKVSFNQRREITERQSSLRATKNEILQRVNEREGKLKTARQSRDSINEEMHQLDIRLNTLESEIATIVERIQQEYEVSIHEIETASPDENLGDEQAREHLQQQKETLKKFGAVNLLALEEYRTASEREQFLGEQLRDLTTAKNDLLATITKINQTARQLFVETFDQVKVNFRNLFVELFSGGEADIRLIDPSDPLESDIDIIARPRGKKLLSIQMMSGGERALTAISLLFSLYLVKPSPFCILDEIDAPLDDANCHRFLKIIETFSAQTQFIIITHNKISMEASHNLYGVTMEQFGVSKLVAVRFTDEPDESGEGLLDIVVPEDETDAQPSETVEEAPAEAPVIESPADLPAKVVERMGGPLAGQVTEEENQPKQ